MEAVLDGHGHDDSHSHAEEPVERWVPGPQVAPVGWMFVMPITMATLVALVAWIGMTAH